MNSGYDGKEPSPSMHAIARAAGVNQSTVSRALANSPLVSEATRQRISNLAVEMGYRPDPALRALIARRKRVRPATSLDTIGIIHRKRLPNYCEQIKLALLSAVEAAGFRHDIFTPRFYSNPHQHKDLNLVVKNRGIRGMLLIFNPQTREPLPKGLDLESIIPVCVGGRVIQPSIHCVQSDRAANVSLALKQSWKMGYRRVGLCLKGSQGTFARDVTGSYFGTWFELTGRSDFLQPYVEDWAKEETETTRKACTKWLRQNRPDCLLVSHQFMRRNMMECWPSSRRRPCTVWFDATQRSEKEDYHVRHDFETMAQIAVQFLEQLLHAHQKGIPHVPQMISIPGKWRQAKS